jgi:aspartate 1-decarboxylase
MTPGDRVLQDAEQYVGQVWGNGNCTGLTFTVSVDVNMPIFYPSNNYPSSEIGPYGNTPSTLLNDTSTSNAFTFTTPVSGPSGPFFAGDLGSIHAQGDTFADGWQLVNGTSDSFTTIDDGSTATEANPGDLFYGVIERDDGSMSVHAGIVQSYDPTAHTLTLIDDFDALRTSGGFLAGGALIGPTTFNLGPPQQAGNGIYAISGDFALYRLTDTSPPVEPQSMLPVAIGGTATISHGFLWSEDPDNTAGQLTYTIIGKPAHGSIFDNGAAATSFTQADIDNGLVRYVENGDVARSDSFTFQVSDPSGNHTPTEAFNIAILDKNGSVVTGGGRLSVSVGAAVPILNPALDTVSLGNTPDQITYTLLLPPAHGTILDNGAAATSFSQADIDSHLVQYWQNGSPASGDGFIFQVSDAAGDRSAPQPFAIEIQGAPQSFTFDDVSTPAAGTADLAAPNPLDVVDPTGGGAPSADTSTSEATTYWVLTHPTSFGDGQG